MNCEYEGDPSSPPCCGNTEMRGSMTAYHFEGVYNSPEDPDRERPMCDSHHQQYEEFWNEQWDECNGIIYEGIAAGQAGAEAKRYDESTSVQDQFESFLSVVKFR